MTNRIDREKIGTFDKSSIKNEQFAKIKLQICEHFFSSGTRGDSCLDLVCPTYANTVKQEPALEEGCVKIYTPDGGIYQVAKKSNIRLCENCKNIDKLIDLTLAAKEASLANPHDYYKITDAGVKLLESVGITKDVVRDALNSSSRTPTDKEKVAFEKGWKAAEDKNGIADFKKTIKRILELENRTQLLKMVEDTRVDEHSRTLAAVRAALEKWLPCGNINVNFGHDGHLNNSDCKDAFDWLNGTEIVKLSEEDWCPNCRKRKVG